AGSCRRRYPILASASVLRSNEKWRVDPRHFCWKSIVSSSGPFTHCSEFREPLADKLISRPSFQFLQVLKEGFLEGFGGGIERQSSIRCFRVDSPFRALRYDLVDQTELVKLIGGQFQSRG